MKWDMVAGTAPQAMTILSGARHRFARSLFFQNKRRLPSCPIERGSQMTRIKVDAVKLESTCSFPNGRGRTPLRSHS